ncbi:MAG: lipid-binding SYLF domain-containing protein [Rhodanobacter sp.]|nr:lipid-binding SYLF domain-containing protein [Rhodanobacter sp.]
MKRSLKFLVGVVFLLWTAVSWADPYSNTAALFHKAGQSGDFFETAYGYAVFPTIGKGGFGVGAAHGRGRVYEQGRYIGTTVMNQISVGLQLGGQAYSQIVFFEDKRALDDFTSGNFEFGADASAVAVTAGASASAGTTGTSAGASGGKNDATTTGKYYKGTVVFTIVKGGAMYQAAIAGQTFTFTPKNASRRKKE